MEERTIHMKEATEMVIHMKRMLEGSRICIVDADGKRLNNSIEDIKDTAKIVLLDLDIAQYDAIALLYEIRGKLEKTPIIMLTPARPRSFFVEALLHGATDYLIKPYTEEMLLQKVSKYLTPEAQQTETITFDISRYLKSELRKAEKGRFAISAIVLALNSTQNSAVSAQDSILAGNLLYENLKDLFWETDIFIRFASKFYLGIFPFCDEKNTSIINQKIQGNLEELKQLHPLLQAFELTRVCVSFPYDTGDSSQIYDLLLKRVRDCMKEEITAI